MLTALASSRFLQIDDFQSFRQQISDVARQLGLQIVLTDAKTGQQIANTLIGMGEVLPRDIPKEASNARQESIRGVKPTISNVYFGPISKKYIVNVGIPIVRDGVVIFYLSAGIPAAIFADSVSNAATPSQWIVSVIDRDSNVIARSERQDEVVGTKSHNEIVADSEAMEGTGGGVGRFELPYNWVWQRSSRTGWIVSVAVPRSELEAPRTRALMAYAGVSGTVFVLAMAVTFYIGGHISKTIGEMGIDREPTREEFRILFEHNPNGVLVVDDDGQIVMANMQISNYFGYLHDEPIAHPISMLVPKRLSNGEFVSPKEGPVSLTGRELFGHHKDGRKFPIEIALNPISTSSGSFIMVTIMDISDRLLSEQKLMAALTEGDKLRRAFVQAQEAERLRLARELHDETGQNLAAIMIELRELDNFLSDAGRKRLGDLLGKLQQMGRSLHHLAKELRPASIDELGLASAVASYVSEWGERFGITADFHCGYSRLDELPDETRTGIYRIVQEGLTNIAKHAPSANHASIVIDRINGVLQLTIEDDGPGFRSPEDTANARDHGGLGLAGMRERLWLIGGDLVIETSPESGTALFARIPLERVS